MADPGKVWRGPAGKAEPDDTRTELEELAPFIELAREIKRDVDRIAADDYADVEQLSDAIAAIPLAERRRVTEAVFERLPPDVQWAILERVFGDAGIREHLGRERERRLAETVGRDERRLLADAAREARLLDTRTVPAGVELTVGLFREEDVRAAVTRGAVADSCARRLVLRAEAPPRCRVIEDVFNPRGGLFVTREYDQTVWEADRFASHASVEIGAANAESGPESGPASGFEPVLYLGGRADFRTDLGVSRGHLHIGFVMLGDIDVFAG